MFGNPSNSNGGISPFGAMGDVFDDAIRVRRQRDAELRHLNQIEQMGNAHHQEMMDLIGQFNSLREEYANTRRTLDMIAAERDEAYQIMRENESRMGLSREEIRERISEKRNQAREAFDTSIQD